MRLRVITSTLLFLGFWVPSEQTDSERDEPTYKFGIVAGEPNSLDNSTSFSVSSFEECVQKCEEDYQCILASQVADGEPCNLFPWNSVTGVKNNASGGVGQVAFRLYTNQPACELNLANLLNGKNYPLLTNDTSAYLWKIDTAEDGWTITYTRRILEDNLICGNWTFNRPYVDGCNSECLITMVQVFAEPGPLSTDDPQGKEIMKTYEECLQFCYENVYCIVMTWDDSEAYCHWWAFTEMLYFLNKTEASSGKRAAIKMHLNNETCKMTTEELLNDTYVMSDKIKYNFNLNAYGYNGPDWFAFYRVRSTKDYYKLQYYTDETRANFMGKKGCPWYWRVEGEWQPLQASCYHPFEAPGFTQLQAKTLCAEMENELLTASWENFTLPQSGGMLILANPPVLPKWGVLKTTYANYKAWMGLERDVECIGADSGTSYCQGNQQWQWSDTTVPVLYRGMYNQIQFAWAPGHPDSSKNCAYMQAGKMYSADCNQTDTTGFVCQNMGQQHMGVASYASIAAKYGYETDSMKNTESNMG